ncbi:MAG: ABC transporter ATP-binding protein [Candidatus Electryoneaceae bacterium]|nr:ABC transporter ATP-binding protein [Candidatus Electryoneaceae bacterium]
MQETNTTDKNPDHGDRNIVRRLLGYFVTFKVVLVVAFLGSIFIGLADSSIALAVKLLMDLFSGITQAIASGSEPTLHLSQGWDNWKLYDFSVVGYDQAGELLIWMAVGMILLVALKGMVHFVKEYLLWGLTHRVLMRLKRELFGRVVRLPLAYFDRERSGDVLSRVTYDVTQLESAIRSAILLVKSLIYAFIFVTMLFLMEWSLTLFALAVFPLSALIIKYFGDKIRRISRIVSLNVADYTSLLSEALSGIKVIKAFGRERDKEASFEDKIADNYRFNMKIAKWATLNAPIQELLSSTGIAGIILFCGYRMLSGAMTIGDLAGFVVLLTNAYKPIKNLGETNAVIQRAIASARRIFNLIDQPDESVVIGSGEYKPASVEGNLTFADVSFSYNPDDPAQSAQGENSALRGINLSVTAGETVALVGPSGGGKSTLVSLVPRFYPLIHGRIELDDVDIADYNLSYLRNLIAVVHQETILFSGTAEENIRLGRPDATDPEVINAAQAANAHDFIRRLSNGYGTEVGERGAQLSGGQRQRIALARAILRDPRILILDEATSSLDSESERLIQDALDRFRRDRTTLIIAHRLSTVQSADRIAVMADGRLLEIGSHQELYEANGMYRRLHEQQFTV